MKSRESLINLRRFEVDDKRQKVSAIEAMIAEFRQMAADLDQQIKIEEEKAGITDVNHYAYPTFALAAMKRRDNLLSSVQELEKNLLAARDELAAAYEELKKVEKLEGREQARETAEHEAQEQEALDDIGSRYGRA